MNKNYKIITREINTEEHGKEIVIEKKYNLNKDQWKNRLWVMQPALYEKIKVAGGWNAR